MAINTPRMRIPVIVSCPTNLSPVQEQSANIILKLIEKNKLEWRALGRTDYPHQLPLREVLRMIKHCSGGIILGFEQYYFPNGGILRRGSPKEETPNDPILLPTPWNNLEAGILFNQELPIIIFKESGITGGVFDLGITDVFIHAMPTHPMPKQSLDDLDTVFQKWAAQVRGHYYGE